MNRVELQNAIKEGLGPILTDNNEMLCISLIAAGIHAGAVDGGGCTYGHAAKQAVLTYKEAKRLRDE